MPKEDLEKSKTDNSSNNKTFQLGSSFLMLKILIAVGVWIGTFFLGYLLYIYHDLPSIDTLEEVKRERKVTILDHNGDVITTYGDLYGNYVYYYDIPKNLQNAVIAIEDKSFFEHYGVNVWSIIRASIANLRAGHTVQGGSTISQQLAKVLFLSNKKTLKRKLQEVLLAMELEHKYTKKQILAIYLNRIYLGAGIYGIDAAAKYYFAKNVKDLSLYESAIIAGLIQAPSKYAPTNNIELTGNRAYQVLHNMLEDGFINKEQFDKASTTPVQLNTEMLGSRNRNHFTGWVYDQVKDYADEDDKDVLVKTTFNPDIEAVVEDVLRTQLDKISEERKVQQGAVVVMDYDGKVLSMVGGRDFRKSSFNRAVQAQRQPGSSFKMFVYTTAMERGYGPDDEIEDKPISRGTWAPQNFNKNQYLGVITLDEAFTKSINTAAVQLAEKVGLSNVIDTAKKMGIKSKLDYNLSIALGTSSVTLLEMTSAFGTIGNHGYLLDPYGISYIKNAKTGKIIYVKPAPVATKVLSNRTVEIMQDLLAATVQRGTARRAISNFTISGKTGTTQDFRDGWFLGYTDSFVIGVWLGNDDYSPTKNVSGGTYPTIIARDILRRIQKN